jgi:aspartate kinase
MAVALRSPAAVARESPAALAAAAKLGRGHELARASTQCWRRRGLAVRCQTGAAAVLKNDEAAAAAAHKQAARTAAFTVVMKFGGSSVASAERMREVADLILSFPDETPVVVLSAMGKTTNNLLLVLCHFLARLCTWSLLSVFFSPFLSCPIVYFGVAAKCACPVSSRLRRPVRRR